jgi:KaiC
MWKSWSVKLRSQKYRGGYHDFVIQKGGLDVFPRLVAAEHDDGQKRGLLQTGNREIDALLGGALQYGTSVVLLGPAGSGNAMLAIQYARAAADRGEGAAIFAFDERVETILTRTAGLGMDINKHLESGHIAIHPINTAELSPGEFAHRVRRAAEGEDGKPGAKVIARRETDGGRPAGCVMAHLGTPAVGQRIEGGMRQCLRPQDFTRVRAYLTHSFFIIIRSGSVPSVPFSIVPTVG